MKILASDYDGTMKYGDHVTEEDIAAIRQWKDEGNLFVIDTGRSMESILEESRKYRLPVDYYITNNGGMLFDVEGKELFSSFLDNSTALSIMHMTLQLDQVVSYVVNDGWHRHRIIIHDNLEEHRYPGLMPDMKEEELMKTGRYAQIVISCSDMKYASELAQTLRSCFSGIAAYANRYVCDIVPEGISKAHGLHFLSDFLHVDEKNIYAIGDAENDIPLMEFAHQGCCMASADPSLYSHAHFVCDNISDFIGKIQAAG